ncbi:MAG: VOC family protein [Deltaproteobacteria bacterium]|nr:VOC family protein [Deltaproteobacteria bacterium]
MPSRPIVPCVWLDSQAEQAAALYLKTFPGSRVVATSRYPESADNPGKRPRGSVLTVEVELSGLRFTLLNGGPTFRPNPSISFFVHVESVAEVDRRFGLLAEGGEPLMPLGSYPWSERYGWVRDRFGVSWQVMAGRRPAGGSAIAPCLMFSGRQHGRAEEAMRHYAGIFPDGRVLDLARYAAGEGPEGTVKHGRFLLAGQDLVAMDSHLAHDITFDEGLSLQVMCEDQAEVDRYWEALARGGEHGPCGWLEDRFGLSWQVVPSRMADWLAGGDAAARDRAFAAMLTMKKLDVAALERAYAGRQAGTG